MKTVAIIQARTGSTRLPNKVLADIGGRSMLARVVCRTQRAQRLDAVVVATTTADADRVIVDACQALGVTVSRGSELDVLDRYYQAARNVGAEVVVRITSDCPMIDPEVIDQVLDEFSRHTPDYACNFEGRTFPRGLETEAMTFEALERAWKQAEDAYQRVHVTPYIYQHPEIFRLLSVRCEDDWMGSIVGNAEDGNTADGNTEQRSAEEWRWTVDTPQDLELVRALYARLGNDDRFSWRQVLTVLAAEPQLAEINRHIQQKTLEEG